MCISNKAPGDADAAGLGDPTLRHTLVKVPIKSPSVSCKAKWNPTALPSPGKWNEEKVNLKLLLEGGTVPKLPQRQHADPRGEGKAGEHRPRERPNSLSSSWLAQRPSSCLSLQATPLVLTPVTSTEILFPTRGAGREGQNSQECLFKSLFISGCVREGRCPASTGTENCQADDLPFLSSSQNCPEDDQQERQPLG